MKILYLSVHEVLEYDELKMFTELGHECFSHGAYTRPYNGCSLRPPILDMSSDPNFADLVDRFPKNNLHPDMVNDKDIIIIMHDSLWVISNWEKIKHKPGDLVVNQSIHFTS